MSDPVTFDDLETRLAGLVEPAKARALIDEVRRQTGLSTIRDHKDQLTVGDWLIRRGGFAGIVGRLIKIDAQNARRDTGAHRRPPPG